MFDPTSVTLNGITLIAVVFGLVEFIKSMSGWEGKKVTALSAFTGAGLYGLYSAIQLLPAVWGQYITIGFTCVVFGLTASGFYKFVSARAPTQAASVFYIDDKGNSVSLTKVE